MGAKNRSWAHLLVFALVLPMAFSSALPVFARAVAGPIVHLCQCGMTPGHCGCPLCDPGGEDPVFNELAHCGKCGDADAILGAALGSAVLPSSAVAVLPPGLVGYAPPAISQRLASVFLVPSTPPPRFALS